MPAPISSIGTRTISAVAPGSRPPTKTRRRPTSAAARCATRAAGGAGPELRDADAPCTSSENDNGTSRTPVSSADSSSTTDRNSGMVKKMPDCRKNWKPKSLSPPRSCDMRRIAGGTNGSPPRPLQVDLPLQEGHSSRKPPSNQPDDDRGSEQDRRSGLRLDPAPVTRTQHTEHQQAQAGADSTAPSTSIFGRTAGGASAMRRPTIRMMTTTITSPANTQRHERRSS